MKGSAKPIEELMKELPPHLQDEVRDFASFLLQKQRNPTGKALRQDWDGGLKDFRDKYTSVELQHKISEWRIGPK